MVLKESVLDVDDDPNLALYEALKQQMETQPDDQAMNAHQWDNGGLTKDERKMLQELEASGAFFDLRGLIGNRFARDPEGGLDPKYKATKGRDAKAAMRQEWHEKQKKNIKDKALRSKTFRKKEISNGHYHSFGWYVREEGGTPQAYREVLKFSKKCVQMGKPWIKWNGMWERIDYLDITEGFSEEFENSWSLMSIAETDTNTAGSSSSTADLIAVVGGTFKLHDFQQ